MDITFVLNPVIDFALLSEITCVTCHLTPSP